MTKSRPLKGPLAGLTVMIAEDAWHIADALQSTVESGGGTVVGVASTLAEAEQMATQTTFDVAIMDLNLHDELAHTLVERLAKLGRKVIVVSGYGLDSKLNKLVHAHLGKPASADDLITALTRARLA